MRGEYLQGVVAPNPSSRLLTIYDLKLECRWAGTVADGSAVEGTLTFPEVSHENGVDGDGEYEVSRVGHVRARVNFPLL